LVSGVLEHSPPPHASTVQATASSQSSALQQTPHVAVLPSALRQHCRPSPHSETLLLLQVPFSLQTPTWQGSSPALLHCESVQHSLAHPLSGQHRPPSALPTAQ
jgi:hypothetical protein